MPNNFLIVGTLAAFGSLFIYGPPPAERTARSATSRVTATDSTMPPSVTAGRRSAVESSRDPVPLLRTPRASPATSASANTSIAKAEPEAATVELPVQDELDKRTAKAAVELDGYKSVIILGKASNGAWRAKGYRGTTEVMLTVDGTGRVSMD